MCMKQSTAQQWNSKCRIQAEKDTADRFDRIWTCLLLMFISPSRLQVDSKWCSGAVQIGISSNAY